MRPTHHLYPRHDPWDCHICKKPGPLRNRTMGQGFHPSSGPPFFSRFTHQLQLILAFSHPKASQHSGHPKPFSLMFFIFRSVFHFSKCFSSHAHCSKDGMFFSKCFSSLASSGHAHCFEPRTSATQGTRPQCLGVAGGGGRRGVSWTQTGGRRRSCGEKTPSFYFRSTSFHPSLELIKGACSIAFILGTVRVRVL